MMLSVSLLRLFIWWWWSFGWWIGTSAAYAVCICALSSSSPQSHHTLQRACTLSRRSFMMAAGITTTVATVPTMPTMPAATLTTTTATKSTTAAVPGIARAGSRIAKLEHADKDSNDKAKAKANYEEDMMVFRTRAYGREEYTNSISASRDTNISPAEAYNVIRERIPRNTTSSIALTGRVADIGAGAGVSTAILYNELGYRRIDAVDWSDDAWTRNVDSSTMPSDVRWFPVSDQVFFSSFNSIKHSSSYEGTSRSSATDSYAVADSYDIIVYNFAINLDKAIAVAQTFLFKDDYNINNNNNHNSDNNKKESLLLAPVNDTPDYWYKQSYVLINSKGTIVWQSDPDVGAWSVQFQPDITSPTCVGSIWCGSNNNMYQP